MGYGGWRVEFSYPNRNRKFFLQARPSRLHSPGLEEMALKKAYHGRFYPAEAGYLPSARATIKVYRESGLLLLVLGELRAGSQKSKKKTEH
jgi:hypothetical protein